MTQELTYRDITLELREETADQWTVGGLAVPFNQIAEVGGYRESFEKGSFADLVAENVPLYFGHNHRNGEAPIGRLLSARETDNGLEVEAKISKTVRGTEVYQLLKDKVLSKFSVGFKPLASREDNDVTVITRAYLGELSIVPAPAYAGAAISSVREESHSSDDNKVSDINERSDMSDFATEADLVEVRESVEDLNRKIAVLNTGSKGEPVNAVKFRSLGDFAKGLVDGRATKEDAQLLTRAYTGAQTGDLGTALKDAWVARDVKFIEDRRPIWGLFASEPLPATGNNLEYPKVASTSGSVGVQAAEGDDLNYLEIVLTSATAPIKTVGGYSQLSRQVIERSDVGYLNKVLQFQKIQYAKTSNGLVRTALTGASGTNTGSVLIADKAKAITWVNTLIQGVADIEANSFGLNADVWIMSLNQFKTVAGIVDTTNRPVFDFTGAGTNVAGDVSVGGLRGNIAGIPVFVDPLLGAVSENYSYIVSRDALTTHESGPFNLADENIINLTKAFSLYGYEAIEVNDPKGIVKVAHNA